MNIILTNDDGYDAPGIIAGYEALRDLGRVEVVAPRTERSACSHMITLRGPISVERVEHKYLGTVHAVGGTPADCVRLAITELFDEPIDLVVSGINRGANTGAYAFYSGTIAAAREAAALGIRSIAVSQAVRAGVEVDWPAARDLAASMVRRLSQEALPGPGFWSVNFPSPIPPDPSSHTHQVGLATQPVPMSFERIPGDDGRVRQYKYRAPYWVADMDAATDYGTILAGGIAVTAIPLCGRF